MCRMLGLMCNDEDLLACSIYDVRESLRVKNSSQYNGLGVGYYRNDEPLLKKRPSMKSNEIDYVELVEGIASNVLLVHIRQATMGAWKDTNTHPFRFRKWLFAHLGHIAKLEPKRNEVIQQLPSFLRRNIRGETDSEVAFHMFLNLLFKDNKLDDFSLTASELGTYLKDCLEEIDSLYSSGNQHPSLAMLVTNGQIMAAVCRGIGMHYSHREGILECPLHERTDQQLHLHRRFRGIMLGADMQDPGHQWREITSGSLLSISKTLELKVYQL